LRRGRNVGGRERAREVKYMSSICYSTMFYRASTGETGSEGRE
jgi:hypothetical protein